MSEAIGFVGFVRVVWIYEQFQFEAQAFHKHYCVVVSLYAFVLAKAKLFVKGDGGFGGGDYCKVVERVDHWCSLCLYNLVVIKEHYNTLGMRLAIFFANSQLYRAQKCTDIHF